MSFELRHNCRYFCKVPFAGKFLLVIYASYFTLYTVNYMYFIYGQFDLQETANLKISLSDLKISVMCRILIGQE